MAEADVFLTVFSTGIGLHSSLIVNQADLSLTPTPSPTCFLLVACPSRAGLWPIVQTLCTHAHTLRFSKVGSLTHHQNMLGITVWAHFFV